jgi:putative ABC transport system permease protein
MTRLALKGLAARPLRTALTAFAIVIGVAFVCAAYTLTDTLRGAADSLSSAAYRGTDAVVVAHTSFRASTTSDVQAQSPTIPAADLAAVRRVSGVAVAAGDVSDSAEIIGRDGKPAGSGPYFGAGLDSRTPGATRLTPFRLRAGRWATGPGEVVIDQATADKEHYRVGDLVRVSTTGTARRFRVTGIATFASVKSIGTATVAVFDLRTAQRLYGRGPRYDRILVAARPGVRPADLRRALASAVGPHAEVRTAAADDRFQLAGLKEFIKFIKIILLVFAGVAVVVAAFTIFNSLSITVAQRTREFGLLRMVGAGRGQVRRGVLAEVLCLGLAASLVGLAAGIGLASGLNALFTAVGISLPNAGLVVSTRTIVAALAVGVLATLAAGALPARRATRVTPVEALRDGDAAARRPRLPARAVRAVASVVGRPAERLGGSAGRLARRNAMRNPGRTAVTALALTIGVMLVTAVTVVAQGLKSVTVGALDRHVQASAVIVGADGQAPIDPRIERVVARVPGVRAVSSVRQDGALAYGHETGVTAIDPATIGRLYRHELTAGSLSALGRDGALVTDRFASEHHLRLGDPLTVTSMKGVRLALTVRAIEHLSAIDPLALGPITISRQAFAGAFDMRRNRMTLVDGPVAAVCRALAAFPDAKVQTKAAFVDDQAAWIGKVLAILWVLLALAVVVSLFGIVNTLVLSTFERTRELGTLRAVGMSRRQVRRMVRHESVITAVVGALLGIGAGLGLAGGLTAWLSKYGLGFQVPVGSLVAVAIVAALAGVLAAAMPARRASRVSVLGALAYE